MRKLGGFTLIELLVSISIIAILAGLLLPNFMGARERARDASKKQDLMSVKNALRMYYNDKQQYPATASNIGATLASYLPAVASVGFTYTAVNSNDGFQLCVGLEAGTGDDVAESRNKCVYEGKVCGITVDANIDRKLFVVCAN